MISHALDLALNPPSIRSILYIDQAHAHITHLLGFNEED